MARRATRRPVAVRRSGMERDTQGLQRPYSRYVQLAAAAATVPMAAICARIGERAELVASIGLVPDSRICEDALCREVVRTARPLVVPDATQDARFRDGALVRGDPGVRFFAGVPIRSAGGSALGALCVFDRTPRTLATGQIELLVRLAHQAESDVRTQLHVAAIERDVESSRRAARSLFERAAAAPEAFLLYRVLPALHTIELAPAFAAGAGVSQDASVDEAALLELVHPEDRPVVSATLHLPAGASHPLLVRWRGSDGDYHWIEQFNQLERNEQGDVVAFEAHGTPRNPQAEHLGHLASSRAALVASIVEQERHRQELLALVVHDFKAPLSSILAASYMLGAGGDLSPTQRELLDEIEASACSLDRQVLSLLDLYTHEVTGLTARPESADVAEIVREAVARVEVYTRLHGHRLEVRADGPLPARVDRDLLRRSIENLLDNASRYARSTIRVELDALGDVAAIVVRDDGPGIPPDERRQIFEKFRQLAHQRRGRGLGLTFCKLAAEAHGGTIYVTDNVPGGAAFHLRVPLAS